MSIDYRPSVLHIKQIKFWWLIPVFMVIGALFGLLTSFFLKPTYEAVAAIATNFEINTTDEITELMLDGAINHVGELAFNPAVIDQLIEAERSDGNNLTLESLKKISSIERRMTTTLIKVKWQDRMIATRIANHWGEILYKSLEEAYEQALIAEDLSTYINNLEACSVQPVESDPNNNCDRFTLSELTDEITIVSTRIAEARNKSLGLHPLLLISQFSPAETPSKPLYYAKGSIIFAGALLGLLVALALLEIKYSNKSNTHQ